MIMAKQMSTVCRLCREGVLCMRLDGCGLRVGLGEAVLARGAVGRLSCSMLLERPPFTSRPTLLSPIEEKKRRRKSFGRPSSFLERGGLAFLLHNSPKSNRSKQL